VPAALALPQRITPCDPRGRRLAIESKATLGAPGVPPGTVRVERPTGVRRDRLTGLTRTTPAVATTADTGDALLDLASVAPTWLRPHPALRLPRLGPTRSPDRRFVRRTPARALGLTDHPWSWIAFLRIPPTSSR
jgi:hypothetical protein